MIAVEAEIETRRRLRWQCRRGMLELDLLFTRFLDERYDELSEMEQISFRKLLAQPDHVLLAWLHEQEAPPPELQSILRKLI